MTACDLKNIERLEEEENLSLDIIGRRHLQHIISLLTEFKWPQYWLVFSFTQQGRR